MKTPARILFRRAAAAAAVVSALALAAPPAAAITLENYQKHRLDSRELRATTKSMLEVRIEGVLTGLLIANRAAVAAGAKPLFCPAANTQMRGPEALKLLDTELTTGTGSDGKAYPGSTNIEEVMLKVAQKRWPCTR